MGPGASGNRRQCPAPDQVTSFAGADVVPGFCLAFDLTRECSVERVVPADFELPVSFRVPPGQLGLIAVLAVVGVVGAIAPARRGARIDVLSAIRNE